MLICVFSIERRVMTGRFYPKTRQVFSEFFIAKRQSTFQRIEVFVGVKLLIWIGLDFPDPRVILLLFAFSFF